MAAAAVAAAAVAATAVAATVIDGLSRVTAFEGFAWRKPLIPSLEAPYTSPEPPTQTRPGQVFRDGLPFDLLSRPLPVSRDEGVERETIPARNFLMNIYPADEQRISEVERGRSCKAILPLPPGKSLTAGDTILFALAEARGGQEPIYVKGGDSVLVSLTDVTELDKIDPSTGQALFQLCWKPLGQGGL